MPSPAHDVRLAVRGLRRNPLFAAVAVASLALGIGANSAIYTLIDQILLRRLPVKSPGELVMLHQQGAHAGSNMGARMHSYPMYREFQQRAEPFSEVLARRIVETSVTVDGQTERLSGEMVSGNYFSMLGVAPAIGRVFSSAEDDRVYQGHPVVVLSYDYWVRRFSRDPAVVGRKILVNNYPMTIVGVSAAGFAGLDPTRSPQIRVPILMKPAVVPEWDWLRIDDERTRWVQVFARLKPGYTVDSAAGPLQGLFLQIRQHEMTLPGAKDFSAYVREQFMKGTLQLAKADIGYSQLRNDFSTPLLVLMSMVGLVLLIACGFARQKEIAVRLSVGASRGQLVAQLLTESLLLAGLGGLFGLAVASGLTRALIAVIPAEGAPLLVSPTPDVRVLSFTFLLTLVTGVVFGLLPALRASRPDTWGTLKDTVGAVSGSAGSLVLRKGLVAAQIALSFLLLFGAGLFVQSLQNLKGTDTGVALDNLVTFQISPALSGYDEVRTRRFYDELKQRLERAPGVVSAAWANVAILSGDEWDSTMSVEGHQAKDGEDMQAFMNSLSPDYFKTMRIPMLEGRDFRPGDEAEKTKVAIVNKRFADHFFPGQSAVGRRLAFGDRPGLTFDIEIIGVAANSLYEGPREGVRRQVFIPTWGNNSAAFYVRGRSGSDEIFALARRELAALDVTIPAYQVKTLGRQLDETLLTDRLIASLSAGFGLLATLLASVGLYGVLAFVVARRRKELGLRLALGADPSQVVWLVMKEVLTLLAVGLALGLPAAVALGRVVGSQLYGIEGSDPWMAVATTVVLTLVSVVAGFIPARRASQIDPNLALRYE